jgi:hypothetical protein
MDASERFKILVAIIALLTLVGLLVIVALLMLWRRYNNRVAAAGRRERSATNYPDAWTEAGHRMTPGHDDDQDEDGQGQDLIDPDNFSPDDFTDENDQQDDEHK